MGIVKFPDFRSLRGWKLILTAAIIVTTALLVLVFIRYRMETGPAKTPQALDETKATLSIKGFHHTATRKGRTSLILDAESARLYSDQNRAVLSNVEATFFAADRSEAHLTSEKGELNTKTRDMSASGSVTCRYKGYVLKTENLHYKHESRIIYTDTPLTVIGPESRFKADSGRFEIKSNKL
ncbi:MAG: LPS export ABC transporter periplasmic protein LptC, partial [Desulfobacterales bacterium]|nr:LPS export ABC transporter periplasmic protein LptC [Desulfobacterales bacterium]